MPMLGHMDGGMLGLGGGEILTQWSLAAGCRWTSVLNFPRGENPGLVLDLGIPFRVMWKSKCLSIRCASLQHATNS